MAIPGEQKQADNMWSVALEGLDRHTGQTIELGELFLLRPDVIYLNHGAQGACARPVFEAYQRWQLEFERQPAEFTRRHGGTVREAREALAGYLGTDADNLVYVVNATMGMNIVARSLPLEAGDQVLSTDHEYGAIERTWEFNCARRGAVFVRQPIPYPPRSPEEVVEAVWAGVTERTRVLTFSHITSPTATILPARELVRRAREAGIITVIDGAHAPGQVPLSLDELGVDFYTGNCHKWMMTPKGSAFLYARPEVQDLLEPLVVSWGWHNERLHGPHFVDEQQLQGTRDLSAFLAVPSAIEFMDRYGWDDVRRRCHELAAYARQQVARITGCTEGVDGEWFAQMTSIPLPPCDPASLAALLRERYNIEIPVLKWNGHVLLRLSVQGYNTQDDIDVLLGALRDFFDRQR